MLVAASLACADPVSVESDVLVTRVAGDVLELTNITATPVYYFAADRHTLAVVDWAPCTEPSTCASVAAASTRRVPLEEVSFFTGETSEIVVYHWRLVPAPGSAFVPDSIRASVLELR